MFGFLALENLYIFYIPEIKWFQWLGKTRGYITDLNPVMSLEFSNISV